MKPVIDLDREYGVVLEGGGAKGAYQIGAWKALKEAGIKIKGISGTSVGALNGALMCMGDLEKAEEVWQTISYSKVMDVDDNLMKDLFEGKLELKQVLEMVRKHLKDGGMDVTPLKNLIAEMIDVKAIQASNVDFFVQTFHVDSMKGLHINMKEIDADMIGDMLLASAYLFPVFKIEKIHGSRFLDGGVTDKVPVSILLQEGYKDILMIRIHGIGVEKYVKIPDDVNVVTIEPTDDLGSIVEFDPEKSRRNMTIGYYDAMKVIYGLTGCFYYIENAHDESFYMKKLCNMKQFCDIKVQEGSLRNYMENVLPKYASELKLSKEWNYTDLYLAMLETTAMLLGIPKYKIYTVEELQIAVKEKGFAFSDPLPYFLQMILNS